MINSSFHLDEGKQVFHGRVNLGIAVDMNQEGLVVVSVKRADESWTFNPADDMKLEAGMFIVYMGNPAAREKLAGLA